MTNRRILMIAYHFHPDREIGAVRSVKFAKYLPAYDWLPVILTVKPEYYGQAEQDPLGFDCEIHRTSKIPVPDTVYLKIKALFRRKRQPSAEPASDTPLDANTEDPFVIQDTPLWKRFIFSLSSTPDENIGWLIPGTWKALKLIRRRKIDSIYSSGSPWTCHLIGLISKTLTGKSWVADFRDPWIPLQKPAQFITPLSRKLERWMERKVVLKADIVLTATEEHRDEMKKRYFPELESKCVTILNGYDEDDFQIGSKSQKKEKSYIEILSAGNLYFGRDPSSFLETLGDMIEDKTVDRTGIRVNFYGGYNIDFGKIREIIGRYDLGKIVGFHRPVSRDKYAEMINNTDILLLLQSSQAANQIPGKTYEYLATGNRIIALVPGGATANLLSGFDSAMVADPADKTAIRSAIESAIDGASGPGQTRGTVDPQLSRLTRRKLAGNFAEMLNKLMEKGLIDTETAD